VGKDEDWWMDELMEMTCLEEDLTGLARLLTGDENPLKPPSGPI
jgi:hypothetical protein